MANPNFNLDEIPQANDLIKVGHTVIAVSKGCNTFQLIAAELKMVDRQARYYRKAAEILGLIKTGGINNSLLTDAGKNFIRSAFQTNDILKSIKPYFLAIPLIREVYDQVSTQRSVSDKNILEVLIQLTGSTSKNTTIVRRLSTFVSWLKQVDMLKPSEKDNSFTLIPLVVSDQANLKKLTFHQSFETSLTSYLHIPKTEEDINWLSLFEEYSNLKSIQEKKNWLESDIIKMRFARYVIGISSKEEFEIEELDCQLAEFEKLIISHARLLVERDRSLRFITKSIGSGGNDLEQKIEKWLQQHGLQFERAHLLRGSSKNVDFFIESLNLAIESKYSKTSGTKHSGAIHDLMEISKAKKHIKNLKVGVALAGDGFDQSFFSSLSKLYDNDELDFILPYSDVGLKDPSAIKRASSFKIPKSSDLAMKSKVSMDWDSKLNIDEQGLFDAAFWLKKYSSVSYITFESRLQMWISQTPYAIECLRLILGWSETQLHSFILNSIPNGINLLKNEEKDPEHVSLLVRGITAVLKEEDLKDITEFFDSEPTINDFILARMEAFDGIARKKHQTSKTFIEACKSTSPFKVLEQQKTISLKEATNLQSNFSIIDNNGKEMLVLCKYYSADGSVMSDLVKKLEVLTTMPEASQWIIIVDGAGWKKRAKDLIRLLTIAKGSKFQLYNLSQWKEISKKAG